jgi:hypothetical protein
VGEEHHKERQYQSVDQAQAAHGDHLLDVSGVRRDGTTVPRRRLTAVFMPCARSLLRLPELPRERVTAFTVPLAAPACTALVSIDVPLKHGKATTKTLRGCGELGKCVDMDKLKLHCLPAS